MVGNHPKQLHWSRASYWTDVHHPLHHHINVELSLPRSVWRQNRRHYFFYIKSGELQCYIILINSPNYAKSAAFKMMIWGIKSDKSFYIKRPSLSLIPPICVTRRQRVNRWRAVTLLTASQSADHGPVIPSQVRKMRRHTVRMVSDTKHMDYTISLTHCGLVTPYVDRYLGQHWLR